MLGAERWLKGRPLKNEISWTLAAAIGAAQLVAAIFPGTSRSGATIVMALLFGLQRPLATEFSFLLGVPTLLAAGGLQIVGNLRSNEPHEEWALIALGTRGNLHSLCGRQMADSICPVQHLQCLRLVCVAAGLFLIALGWLDRG